MRIVPLVILPSILPNLFLEDSFVFLLIFKLFEELVDGFELFLLRFSSYRTIQSTTSNATYIVELCRLVDLKLEFIVLSLGKT